MPDAYLIEPDYPPHRKGTHRLVQIKEEFGALLGSKVVQLRRVAMGRGHKCLLTRNADDPTYYFPTDHPLSGRDRYDWREIKAGVKEGTLLDDDGRLPAKDEEPKEFVPKVEALDAK